MVYFRVRANVETRERGRFERVVEDKRAAIEQMIPACVGEMMGLRGLFAADTSVSSDQWQKYVDSTRIQTLHPGIRTLGFLEKVKANQQQSFLERLPVRSAAKSGIQPSGDRPVYFPVAYLNRFDPNSLEGVGRDHFASLGRHPIMEMARDTGQPMSTGRVVLGPDDAGVSKDGFVIYLPVYKAGAPTATVN